MNRFFAWCRQEPRLTDSQIFVRSNDQDSFAFTTAIPWTFHQEPQDNTNLVLCITYESREEFMRSWSEGKTVDKINQQIDYFNHVYGVNYDGPIYMIVRKEYFEHR